MRGEGASCGREPLKEGSGIMVRRSWMLELPSVFVSIRTERRQASDMYLLRTCYTEGTCRAH